jgi:tetratricopeptide (TPR) repeat protein
VSARRVPNARLRALLNDTGWAGHAFAEAVNAVGREAGLTLHYDRSAVAHWLTGTRPPAAVRAVVAETLSRRLHRPITAADAGFADAPVGAAPEPPGWSLRPGAAVHQLVGLSSVGRQAIGGLAYRLSASSPPDFPTLVSTLTEAPTQDAAEAAVPSVGLAQIETASLMLGVFADADTALGGGHSRRALSAYLAHDVAAWLTAPGKEQHRRRLLSIAASLSYLAGYMCFDERLGGAAQSYYRTAAQLSAEAADPAGYATALRGMSVLAYTLGHHVEALELARTAEASSRRVPAAQAAFLAGQVAVAAAAAGGRHDALTNLRVAERSLEHADGPEAKIGSYHEAALAHQRAEALAAIGDSEGAIRALAASLRLRPAGERRARALTTARLAELHLRQGRLEQACALWHDFCDDYPHLHSARADDALRSLRARLRPYRRNGTARAVLARTEPLRPNH